MSPKKEKRKKKGRKKKKEKGRYELKRGNGNNNEQYTFPKASDSKEEVASRAASGAGWVLTWPKREKEKKNKIP